MSSVANARRTRQRESRQSRDPTSRRKCEEGLTARAGGGVVGRSGAGLSGRAVDGGRSNEDEWATWLVAAVVALDEERRGLGVVVLVVEMSHVQRTRAADCLLILLLTTSRDHAPAPSSLPKERRVGVSSDIRSWMLWQLALQRL